MELKQNFKIGILAFGSLINDPGEELKALEVRRIDCKTPFKIEFARISSTRCEAPTLIPVDEKDKGKKVNAKIIILNEGVTLEQAKSILWRRECRINDKTKTYIEPTKPNSKKMFIGEYDNFQNVGKVIYTKFLIQTEYGDLTLERLATFAIESILSVCGEKGTDGIRYLLSTKEFGIKTELSEEYEKSILTKTECNSLSEAILKLDIERKMNKI